MPVSYWGAQFYFGIQTLERVLPLQEEADLPYAPFILCTVIMIATFIFPKILLFIFNCIHDEGKKQEK